MRNGEDENGRRLDRQLEEWELREYRLFKPDVHRMVNEYKFTKKMWKFLGWTSFYAMSAITGVYAAKDVIGRVIKALFQ